MIVYAWTPCSDGTIKKIDATSIVTTVTTGCSETWIAVANKLALVPGRRGEVVSMNGLGTIKDQRTLQHRIAIAVGVVNDVYCFDGRGKGTIVTLDNNGLITVGEKFTCSGVVDPMNAILDGTAIYIACRNEDVYSFETTTQVTIRISRNHDDVLTSVVDNNTITKLHNNTIYARLFGGAVIGGTDYFIGNGAIHTTTSRIIDSRIRSDGICTPVGSASTHFIKTCPSRESVQWIADSAISSEVEISSEAKMVVFANDSMKSNESDPQFGSMIFAPTDNIVSIGETLTWKASICVIWTELTMAVAPTWSYGGASNPRVSWNATLDSSGTDCGIFGTYISSYHAPGTAYMMLDIWQALRDGVWDGSITVPFNIVHAGPSSGGGGRPPEFTVGNWNFAEFLSPVVISYLPNLAYSYVSPCATPFTASRLVTFNDNGTISIS